MGGLCSPSGNAGAASSKGQLMEAPVSGRGAHGRGVGPGGLGDADRLPVHRIMDPAPYTLLEEMPAPRLYPLFTRTNTNAACVVSRRGEFRGLLRRQNLMSATSSQFVSDAQLPSRL